MKALNQHLPMYIGQVAKRTGLTVKAIRFYEEKGLIPTPKRLGRYRVYNSTDLEILTLIKEAKSMGIRIAQLQQMIHYQNGKVDWHRINGFLQTIKQSMKDDVSELNRKIDLIDQCMAEINS